MVVTLPFVWLLLDYWPLERISHPLLNKDNDAVFSGHLQQKRFSSLLIEKIPFFILSGIVCIITWTAQQEVGALKSVDTFSLSSRIANGITSYVSYIDKMLFPHDLAVVYPFTLTNISNLNTLLCGLLLVGISFLVLRYSRKHKYLFVGGLVLVFGNACACYRSNPSRMAGFGGSIYLYPYNRFVHNGSLGYS